MLNSKQNGFRKERSALNALAGLKQTIQAKNSKNEKTIFEILDLNKAFETVKYEILRENNLKLIMPEEFFSNCWRISYETENNLYKLMEHFKEFEISLSDYHKDLFKTLYCFSYT